MNKKDSKYSLKKYNKKKIGNCVLYELTPDNWVKRGSLPEVKEYKARWYNKNEIKDKERWQHYYWSDPERRKKMLARKRDLKKAMNTYSSFSDGNILMDKTAYGNASPLFSLRRYLNELAATIPYYNAELRPEQNWITGQYRTFPVGFGKHNWNVLLDGWSTDTQTINDPVLSVIADTNREFKPPKKSLLGGAYKLNTDEYAQLVYLTASTKIGGKRLYDKLTEVINKPNMKKNIKIMRGDFVTVVNEEVAIKAQTDARNEVVEALNKIMSIYKTKAAQILEAEYLDPQKQLRIKTVESEADKLKRGITLDNLPQVPF